MEGVIPYRAGIILPTEKGMPETVGESSVCAILLGAISHHPLGMYVESNPNYDLDMY